MTGPTRAVAGWVAGLDAGAVPEAMRNTVRHHLLDTIGCGIQGRGTPWAQAAEGWALAERPEAALAAATVWGDTRASLSASQAAFVNGIAAHAFELDDYHNVKIHPGAAVIPAAVAVAEKLGRDGTALMTAIAAGYEVMTRTSAALEPSTARLRGWHLTGITGPFGAAAAAAVLMRLDAETTASALGLAGTQASGLFAFNADGAMSKRFHAGHAARNGVAAAELAARGYTGPTQVYEAEDGGYLAAHSDAADAALLTDGLGETWRAQSASFKPYACCGSLHSYIDAACELRERFGGTDGRRIRVGLSHVVDVQCGYDYAPSTPLNAQMSARFCVATALLKGRVLLEEFEPACLGDPQIVALAERLELVHDPALDAIYPADFVGWVAMAATPGGDDFERAYLLNPSGSAANPNKDAAIVAKFHDLTADLLDADQARRVADACLALEAATARDLVDLLAQPARQAAQ